MNNFRKKIHLTFHLRGSEFDSDLKHSDKEYIYLTIYNIKYDILCCKSFSSGYIQLQCSSSKFFENFLEIYRKRTVMETIFRKFKVFKVDSGKGVFLSVYRTPFYGCFQTLNGNALLWMITLFGADTPASSKICQKVEAFLTKCPEILKGKIFYSLFAQVLRIFWYVFLWTKFVILKKFLCKDMSGSGIPELENRVKNRVTDYDVTKSSQVKLLRHSQLFVNFSLLEN